MGQVSSVDDDCFCSNFFSFETRKEITARTENCQAANKDLPWNHATSHCCPRFPLFNCLRSIRALFLKSRFPSRSCLSKGWSCQVCNITFGKQVTLPRELDATNTRYWGTSRRIGTSRIAPQGRQRGVCNSLADCKGRPIARFCCPGGTKKEGLVKEPGRFVCDREFDLYPEKQTET